MKKNESLKAKKVENSEVLSLEESVRYHLENNMTVPPPETHIDVMVRICIDAIKAVNEHDLQRMIDLGERISTHRVSDDVEIHVCPAWEIVKRFRLDHWLNSEWQ